MPQNVKVTRMRSFTVFTLAILLALPSLAAAAVTYNYDVRHRLTGVTYDNGATITYSYDGVGNRLTRTSTQATSSNYEDGEDGLLAGWDIYDSDPAGAVIDNVYDDIRQNRVIEFTGNETSNGYRLRNSDSSYWNDTEFKVMEWSMRYSENFVVYIATQTTQGFRYIYYTSADSDNLGTGTYIHHGLGAGIKDGNWHTITRDLEYDLKEAQPDNELQEILGFLIRGSGRVDDITTRIGIPSSLDSDGDTISDTDEINIYGTHPYHADSDGDSISDGEELAYWGTNWNSDPDNDGLINLLDSDSDNDGITDGIEFSQGTDPVDQLSVPTAIVYEDGEDTNLNGWDIYDNDPPGAVIDIVFDDIRQNQVVEFTGSGTANGYRLRNNDFTYWNDANFKVMEWSMRYSENFTVYIAAQTRDGFRYIYYTAADSGTLGTGTYIHHGLGTGIKDGNWHTIIRDLEYDLKEAQPDNELQEVFGFLIRGSGRVDDIKTLNSIPSTLDSDGDTIPDNDELNTYGTHPYHADSDGDTILDGVELAYWGANWSSDPDNDGQTNITDFDSDGDSFSDGVEVAQGTDPVDNGSVPTSIIYEDGEDGNMDGWDIYDGDPAGATISNVYDDLRNSQVVEFSGTATSNGYRLRNADFSYWYEPNFKVIEWSMRYSENFVVYVATQTSDGFRYIYYTSADSDNLGDSTYVHHGLGAATKDGSWHTITRDLDADLKEAQPDNKVEEVLGFLIRGSGRIDDIKTHNNVPTAP